MKRYWFSDGLVEIGLGVGLCLLGGVLALLGWLPTLTLKIIALPSTGLLLSGFIPWGIAWARARWWPLAEPLTPYPLTLTHQLWGTAVMLPPLVGLAFLYAQLSGSVSLLTPALWLSAAGLLFGFIPLALGFTSGVVRFYALAVPMILAGGVLGRITADLWAGLLLLWLGMGGLFLLSGTAALLRFQSMKYEL